MKRDKAETLMQLPDPTQPSRPSTEEETAKLKDRIVTYDYLLETHSCTGCTKVLSNHPIILCNKCGDVPFCVSCFLAESLTHNKSHDYYVLDRLNYPLYSPTWTAKEEINFMKCIEMNGVDNWLQIAKVLETKTPEECEAHYYTTYYKSANEKFPAANDSIVKREPDGKLLISRMKEEVAEEKELEYMRNRPQIFNDEEIKEERKEEIKNAPKHGIDIPGADAILGYIPLRGDFNIEYDNEAEKLLSEMEFFEDDDEEEIKLKEEILKLYNARLDERIKRKKFVIERGLLEPKKPLKGDREKSKEEKEIYALMRPFMRFCEGNEFNELVKGLIKERNLRKELDELRLYKSLGLPRIEQIDKYLERKPLKAVDSTVATKKALPTKKKPSKRPQNRKVIGLTEIEKHFCKDLKVAEEDYAELKKKVLQKITETKEFNKNSVLNLASKKVPPDTALIIYDFVVRTQLETEAVGNGSKKPYKQASPW